MSNKMDIWNAVCKTDPKHTKQVNQRGGFTSIDAMYQVQRATEQFGPCGQGWGYTCEYSTLDTSDGLVVFCDLVLWWGDPKANYFGPVRGCNSLVSGKGRLDEDAPKKAMTDALTKALSHLGFSADVFLGLYDDNKYVAGLKAESKKNESREADMAWVTNIIMKLKDVEDPTEFTEKVGKVMPLLANKHEEAVAEFNIFIEERSKK